MIVGKCLKPFVTQKRIGFFTCLPARNHSMAAPLSPSGIWIRGCWTKDGFALAYNLFEFGKILLIVW